MMTGRNILFLQKKFQPRRIYQGITFSYNMRRDILHCMLQNSASMQGSFSQYWGFLLTGKFTNSFFASILWEKFPKSLSPLQQSTLSRISFSFWFKYRLQSLTRSAICSETQPSLFRFIPSERISRIIKHCTHFIFSFSRAMYDF